MKVLITGIDGFLGAAISSVLRDDGHLVVGLSNGARPRGLKTFFFADITQRQNMFDIFESARPDLCIHLAAMAHAEVPKEREHLVREVNVNGAVNVADAAVAAGARDFIYFSTAKVLADTTSPDGIDETVPPCPRGIYAESKFEVEQYLLSEVARGTIRAAIVRPVAVMGQGDVKGNYAKMRRMVARGFFPLLDEGRAKRSVVFASTVAERVRRMVKSGLRAGGQYVFSDGAWSVEEIVAAMRVGSGFAFCPTIPTRPLSKLFGSIDSIYSRMKPGETPARNLLKRLTESFVIHPHLWNADFGELMPPDIFEAVSRLSDAV